MSPSSSYSVVVVHYGDPSLTVSCLKSVQDLDPAPREVVVVWNDVATDPATVCPPHVEVLAPGANTGFSGGANLGIRAALESEVEAVLLLNNDAVVERDTARVLLEVMSANDDVAAVGPRIMNRDNTPWHDGGRIQWPEGRPISIPVDRRGTGDLPFEVDFVCGCAPLIRGEAFRGVGGFDERYFLTYEDADLSLRLRAAGWQLLHAPAARVIHDGSATLGEYSAVSRYYRLRNRLLFARAHTPDQHATDRTIDRLRRKSRLRAFRWWITGRSSEARAVFAALRDADAGRWGRWRDGRDHGSPG